jgi:hypothetical protein
MGKCKQGDTPEVSKTEKAERHKFKISKPEHNLDTLATHPKVPNNSRFD